MASSSSHLKRYHVFLSFHGPDTRGGFLSHLHNRFAAKGITTFNDQEIERGHTIGPKLIQAIRESRASILVLSKNYASSSWCLDELVEILNCEEQGQIVMTIFYKVDPSDIRKQSGDFGRAFEKTCQGKSEEVKQRWSKALAYVATIAGEHSLYWPNEAEMIQKIARDVSNQLNLTPSRYFGEVGMGTHLRKMSSLLCPECDEAKIIGIWGPAGIGKTTIARVLFSHFSAGFRLKCFMGNLRGSHGSIIGVNDYEFKLSLQSQLLSQILNQRELRVPHLGAIKELLHNQKVFIVLDDVDDLKQLEALAKETSWFGPESRIIVTTENKKILWEHGIIDIYHVDFPSKKEALEILCLSAFKQCSPPDVFEEIAYKVAELCGNLPLGLRVVGSSLHGLSRHEWELQLPRLETSLSRIIEDVLRVGYDRLFKEEQSLFLFIACFFNYKTVDSVTTMLADSILDVRLGLRTLADNSLVHISTDGLIVMHNLLQQFGRQVVAQQSDKPGKNQFLRKAEEIRDVLANEAGTGSLVGKSFDDSKRSEVSLSRRVFEGFKNIPFLTVFSAITSLLELPDWDSQPKTLVKTDMSKLEKIWIGIQSFKNPKKIDLEFSLIKEMPNLSKATNLEELLVFDLTQDKKVEPVIEEKKREIVSKSSTMMTYVKSPPYHKVFINFCSNDLGHGFIHHLVKALERDGVNIYVEINELPRGDLTDNGIKESNIALVIFSSGYTESRLSLKELVKIKDLMEGGKLLVIPIFYKVKPLEVTLLKGDFGVNFWNLWRINRDHHIITWKEALKSVASLKGIYSEEHISESEFITVTVKSVLERISLLEGESTEMHTGKGEKLESYLNTHHLFGIEKRMEQLEKKLDFDCNETRIIGVVGMPGIGKTTLATMMHKKWNCKFTRCLPLLGIRQKSKDYGTVWLRKTLLEVLLEGKFPDVSDKTTHESVKDKLIQTKVFVVLDDVSDKEQLEFLLGDLDWIKKGSKIVITTCDKSLLEGCAHDTYVIPVLDDKEAFQLFNCHAFDNQICSLADTFPMLSRMFVDYARGHPMVLNLLGRELRGKDKSDWVRILAAVTSSSMMFQDIWRLSTDQLNEWQKDVFLDIVCFFKSEDEYFVRSLLDSGDPDFIDTVSEVRDLANKFLITISNGRVEMNDLLYMFGKDLSSPQWLRLWNYKDTIKEPKKMEKLKANKVRGIFFDVSKLTKCIYLDSLTFINMPNLRYLKIYDSCCPQQCKADCKINFHDGFKFPLKELRYLHWVKFPWDELPPEFRPENLVDLRLPYSKVERLWEGVKNTPRLKWVDVSYSSKLLELSALSKAENLQRLNLEGCSSLAELPVEIQNMKSLVLLNLRGCIGLLSLPAMNLISLKILILSGCTNLKDFQLISEILEVLHLDATAIKGLPPTIRKLQRLVILNLKNCKMLKCLPYCLRELKALEELILSGCSRLKNLSDVRESMKHLKGLLIDRIGAKEIPNITCVTIPEGQVSADMFLQSSGLSKWPHDSSTISSLQRLSLSGNDFVSLQSDIWRLYDLKWLDVRQCRKLRSIPMLPPRLRYFDAHGCESLERVANPLALPVPTEHNHATYNFSNCNMLDQDAKNSIISYTRWRSQLVLVGGSVLEDFTGTCFPGWEVPAWFSHQISGPVLKPKLPPHWCDNRFTGFALCAVILLPSYYEQRNRLEVKCKCVFNNEDGSCIRFSCTTGSWSQPSKTPGKIEQSHVFIGYTSMSDIKKHSKKDNEEGCSHTEASFKFQVTDGMDVLEGCEVLKCGFSLVCATDERENTFWDAKTVIIPERIETTPCEARSSGSDASLNEGYSNPIPGWDENFMYEAKSDATPNLQRNEESDGRREIIGSSYHDNTYLEILEKLKSHSFVGFKLRLKQMERVLYLTPGKTRIVGVVGLPGMGKTALATILFEKRGCKFPRHLFLTMPKKCRPEQLRRLFLKELLKQVNEDINDKTTHEALKDTLLQTKVFVVLDDVRDKTQLEFLLGNLSWIKKGSKIVITTCDKSLLAGLVHDTYVVQQLNNKETFQLFTHHAFSKNICPSGTFLSLSRMFVDIAAGNPLDLKLLGTFLCGKDEATWEHELNLARQRFNTKMIDVWRFSIDQLNEQQKYVFLDIVYFFKSENEDFVRSILDLGNLEAGSYVRDLVDKFLITISGGRVEIHDQLYTLGKELGSLVGHRLCNCRDIIGKLTEMKQWETNNARGIFLDMSEMTESIALECTAFSNMQNLLYLKIYDSCCPRQCKADCNLYFPDGLELPLEEVRYLHWIKFPLLELPPDFRPANLVDLRLPYSKIERVWEGVKVTPHLKWVDLRHSSKLLDLTSLSKAENLQRLNLEGCTSLEELPVEIQNMKSLVFLNLRGCIRLSYLPKMNLISLKTLILSDCSNLKEFQLISESVEFLHLDGTSIKGLPPAIQNLWGLVMLNLKNCKMLESLPNCLGKLEFLDELILSGCSRLKNLPDVRHSLKHLQILLLDETGANDMPSTSFFTGPGVPTSADTFVQPYSTVREWSCGVNYVSLLRRLSLSGNNFVSLQQDIGKLYNLNWLDVKHCKKLTCVPTLPPRLQYFDAHGCDSLERVASPLALPVSELSHSTFNFSNCNKLDQDAKDSILSYSLWRSQLKLDDLTRYNEGFVSDALIATCFPGWEVPVFFNHRASGSVLKTKLPPHWWENKFPGMALCAVILFPSYHELMNHLLVKCNCVLSNEDGSRIHFSYTMGSWSEPSSTPGKIESSHVFISYMSAFHMKKYDKMEDEDRFRHTEATFEFQVIDGTKVLEGFEVQKCGFSLVYATDEMRVKFSARGAPVEANQYKVCSENSVAISNVAEETVAAEKSQDRGHEIVELDVPFRYAPLKVTSAKPPITESPASLPEYGTGSNNFGGETHVRASDVDSQLSGEAQQLSTDLVKMPTVASSPQAGVQRSHSQVFVSFHGAELRTTFVSHLVSTLTDAGINVFTDNDQENETKLQQLYKRIEESKIALVIFSKRYIESKFHLNTLVTMDKLSKDGKLLVIPVFYNLRSKDVKNLKGEFGRNFKELRVRYKDEYEKVLKWETSVKSIAKLNGVHSELHGVDAPFVEATVEAVQKALTNISQGHPKPLGGGHLKNFLICKATQAAARIRQVVKAQSFQKKQTKEFGDRKFGMSEERAHSVLAPQTHKPGREHSDDSAQAAAIRIQDNFRGYKGRKHFLFTRQRIIKIQAHVRGYQVRKNVILHWRRKGAGLRGFKSDALADKMQVGTEKEDDDFFKQGRKLTEERLQKALARMKSMVQYPEARDQYRRLLNVVNDPRKQARESSEDAICFDEDLIDIVALLEDDDTLMLPMSSTM